MSEQKELFAIRESVVDWQENIIEDFPCGTVCPICRTGKFQLSISGAVATGECDKCKTQVPYQFYDTRYPYLDEIANEKIELISTLKDGAKTSRIFELDKTYSIDSETVAIRLEKPFQRNKASDDVVPEFAENFVSTADYMEKIRG